MMDVKFVLKKSYLNFNSSKFLDFTSIIMHNNNRKSAFSKRSLVIHTASNPFSDRNYPTLLRRHWGCFLSDSFLCAIDLKGNRSAFHKCSQSILCI